MDSSDGSTARMKRHLIDASMFIVFNLIYISMRNLCYSEEPKQTASTDSKDAASYTGHAT